MAAQVDRVSSRSWEIENFNRLATWPLLGVLCTFSNFHSSVSRIFAEKSPIPQSINSNRYHTIWARPTIAKEWSETTKGIFSSHGGVYHTQFPIVAGQLAARGPARKGPFSKAHLVNKSYHWFNVFPLVSGLLFIFTVYIAIQTSLLSVKIP